MTKDRVLVIEDEILVGLDVVYVLQKAGFGYVEHVATEDEALRLIATQTWSAVVADANLNGRSIERIARLLQEKTLPFVVVSGYERRNLPSVIGGAPILGKPVSYVQLVETVRCLCEASKPLPQATSA